MVENLLIVLTIVLNKQKNLRKELIRLFKNAKVQDTALLVHKDDPSGNSTYRGAYFYAWKKTMVTQIPFSYKCASSGSQLDIFSTVSIWNRGNLELDKKRLWGFK